MSKPKAPKAPDPYQTAQADFSYNNFNQRTPYGNIDVTAPVFGANNRLMQPGTITMSPTPELQQQLDLQNQLTSGALGLALSRQQALYGGAPTGTGNHMMPTPNGGIKFGPTSIQQGPSGNGQLPDLPTGIDFSSVRETPSFNLPAVDDASRQRVEQASFDRARGLLDPVFAEQERGLRGTLADQGLPAGSEARNYDLGQFYDQRNRAYNQAAQDAVLSGGQEQSRMFQDALAGQQAQYGAGMQGRQMDISDQLQNFNLIGQNRATLFNELQALLGQQQVAQPTLQNFYSPQGSSFTNAQGINSNAAAQNYATRTGAQSDMWGGLLGALGTLGGAAILMSDKRMKEDIKKLGKTDEGHNIYSFRYKGSPLMQLGVMAQEVEKKKPEAVMDIGGVKFVDYSKVH